MLWGPRFGASVAFGIAVALTGTTAPAADVVVVDRVAVRYVTPETGGAAQPRFITERELAFFARAEALIEQVPLEGDAYAERYVRAATSRLVARAMLAGRLVQSGSEPPGIVERAAEARAELEDRVGGASVLEDALAREGLDASELLLLLRDQARAVWYVDKNIHPILAISEDSLREAYRSLVHPFRSLKYEQARPRLRRWLSGERFRAAELEFLQSARGRITVATVSIPVSK
jgi:hypothetical protein